MRHTDKFAALQDSLEAAGHQATLPQTEEGLTKRQYIDEHMSRLQDSDALLLANFDDERGDGYIGASCFFEAGWAFALGKPVYTLQPIDATSPFAEDLMAIDCQVINGDMSKIKGGIDE
jgi:hypothetical protein